MECLPFPNKTTNTPGLSLIILEQDGELAGKNRQTGQLPSTCALPDGLREGERRRETVSLIHILEPPEKEE